MVARLIEGFEHSTVLADYAGRWSAAGAPVVSGAYGRYGNGVRFLTGATLTRTLDSQATWVFGVAFRSVTPATLPVLAVLDTGTVQALLGVNAAGQLLVCRSAIGTVLGTSAFAMSPDLWYFVEWRVTIGNTGSSAVNVNGVEVLSLPSVDTQASASISTANQVRLGPGAGTVEYWLDDLYVFDATGSTNTAFVGDVRVERLAPSGAGATTAWTPSTGANYAAVDEAPPNADTDYVSSATAGQTDTYAYGNLVTTSGTVYAVQATAYARKDDAGSRSMALVARPGGTDRLGATQGLGDAYSNFSQVWDVNPDTSAAWTIADVNASSFGQRLIA